MAPPCWGENVAYRKHQKVTCVAGRCWFRFVTALGCWPREARALQLGLHLFLMIHCIYAILGDNDRDERLP